VLDKVLDVLEEVLGTSRYVVLDEVVDEELDDEDVLVDVRGST
jgi:hypothetical protein